MWPLGELHIALFGIILWPLLGSSHDQDFNDLMRQLTLQGYSDLLRSTRTNRSDLDLTLQFPYSFLIDIDMKNCRVYQKLKRLMTAMTAHQTQQSVFDIEELGS